MIAFQMVAVTALILAAVLCQKKHPLLQIALWAGAIFALVGRTDIGFGAVLVVLGASFLITYKDRLDFWYPEFLTLKLVLRLLAVPPFL